MIKVSDLKTCNYLFPYGWYFNSYSLLVFKSNSVFNGLNDSYITFLRNYNNGISKCLFWYTLCKILYHVSSISVSRVLILRNFTSPFSFYIYAVNCCCKTHTAYNGLCYISQSRTSPITTFLITHRSAIGRLLEGQVLDTFFSLDSIPSSNLLAGKIPLS